MTTYCYSNLEGGPIWEKVFPMGQAPETITVAGVILYRDLRAEHSTQRSGDAWAEHYSVSMGARTPQHAKEIAAKCKGAGLDCSFDDHLRLKVNSKEHQRKLVKTVLGRDFVNRDSYFG